MGDFNSFLQTPHRGLPAWTALSPVRGDVSQTEARIASFFPHLASLSSIQFVAHEEVSMPTPPRVGVLFSGGQAPGGHNVICGLSEALRSLHPASFLIGFRGGVEGLLQNRYSELTPSLLTTYLNTGGFDLLGSGRTKIETDAQFLAVLRTVQAHQLSALVMIGGDDTQTNAAHLAEWFLQQHVATQVIGVPKTIDGDLRGGNVELSFGFDTATKLYSELIGNVARDALSAKKYFHFIKLMGRSASHVTLECALQTHPNLALIGEEIAQQRLSLSQIVHSLADLISQRANAGKNYGVVVIPEGMIEFIPEMVSLVKELNAGALSVASEKLLGKMPPALMMQLQEEKDPHGNLQLSKIATEQFLITLVQEELKQRTSFRGKFMPVPHFFGYEGRSAYPTPFDASYAFFLGYAAAALLAARCTGYLASVSHLAHSPSEWILGGVPLPSLMTLEERKGKMQPVIKKALVSLESEPFRLFAQERGRWMIDDDYHYPGPIQYFGPSELTFQPPLSLQLTQHVWALS